MTGRKIHSETERRSAGYSHPDFVRRRAVLRVTRNAFASAIPPFGKVKFPGFNR